MSYVDRLRLLLPPDCITFVESKALTRRFIETGISPGFILAPYPEKLKDNSLHNFILRSFLARVPISFFLKHEYRTIVSNLKTNFDQYYENWRPHKGRHKRYRYRSNAYLPDSPYTHLHHLDQSILITNRSLHENFPSIDNLPNPRLHIQTSVQEGKFNIDRYFSPTCHDQSLEIQTGGFLNSAATAFYPLLKFMGFSRVYLLGADMTMLGSMEYAAPYIFTTMHHFHLFFLLTHKVYNANYKMNTPYYYRPLEEFKDFEFLATNSPIEFIRVQETEELTAPLPFLRTINPEEMK